MGKIYKLTDKNGNVLYPMTIGDAIAVDGATLTKKITTEATQTARGMMSAADKKKLDGIATGATSNKGTVTSVTIQAGTGIAVNDQSAITATGTRTISLAPITGLAENSTYKSVTVDKYGRVTSGSNPTTLRGYGITDASIYDNGEIHLGGKSITPLTQHQSISGKQDKITIKGILKGTGTDVSTAVAGTDYLAPVTAVTTPTADTSSVTQIISGVTQTTLGQITVKKSAFTIAKSVPSDAKFTDTTYNDVTTSEHGLMTPEMLTKLNGIEEGATKIVATAVTSTEYNDSSILSIITGA